MPALGAQARGEPGPSIAHVFPFMPHGKPSTSFFSVVCRQETKGSERVIDLPKVTQQVIGGANIPTKLPSPRSGSSSRGLSLWQGQQRAEMPGSCSGSQGGLAPVKSPLSAQLGKLPSVRHA